MCTVRACVELHLLAIAWSCTYLTGPISAWASVSSRHGSLAPAQTHTNTPAPDKEDDLAGRMRGTPISHAKQPTTGTQLEIEK